MTKTHIPPHTCKIYNSPMLRPLVALLCLTPLATQPAPIPPPPHPRALWTPLPIRSPAQRDLGLKGGEGGQCLHGIARCPADDRRIYLAVDVVGVWRSNDAGSSWQPCRNAGLRTLGTSSIAVHPKDPDRLFVYTQAAWEKPRLPEEGLYMSMDAGQTWTRALAVPNPDPRRGYRHLIDIAPDGRRIYFASYDAGIYRSDNSGFDWIGPLGPKDATPWEIRIDPRNSDLVYLATDDGLLVSQNAGKDFHKLTSLDGDVSSLAIDPQKPDRLYAVLQGQGLFRSDDAGKSFAHLRTGDRQLDHTARQLFQSPIDPRRLILAADTRFRITLDAGQTWRKPTIDTSRSYVTQTGWGFTEGLAWGTQHPAHVVGALACGMFASSDNGLTWTDSAAGYTGFHHGWCNSAVSFSAKDPNRFAFFCYDYAFNLTTDAGQTFTQRGLKEKLHGWWGMYAGDMSPAWDTQPLVIASAGNYWKQQLVRSEDAGRHWQIIPNTEGVYFFVRFHPNDPRIIYADSLRSDDSGHTFKKLPHPISAFAPSRPDTVYAYDQGLVWRSDDRGDSWRPLPAPPRPAGPYLSRRDIQVDPTNPDRLFAMTPPDCSAFDGQHWRLIPASQWASPHAHPFVSRLAIDPQHPTRIVLGLDALGESYLFLSDDAGQSWSDITANLPRLGSNQSLNIHPTTSQIYLGAGFGTWTCHLPFPTPHN